MGKVTALLHTWQQRWQSTKRVQTHRRGRRGWLGTLMLVGVLGSVVTYAGCGTDSNAYGGSQNHVHDILALTGVPHVVLMATHIGLYRTADSGGHWTEVAGGSGQPMEGLMLFKLAQSPVDHQRLYVVAIPRPDNPGAAHATVGIYTSADAGKTWKLAAPATDFPSTAIFSITAGAHGAGQLFALLPSLHNRGVFESDDTGHTWHEVSHVPNSDPTGLHVDPANPNALYRMSISEGLYISTDSGSSWHSASGVEGGVYSVSVAGSDVYVMGDSGFARSQDGGSNFSLVDNLASYSAVEASAKTPSGVYATTGTSILRGALPNTEDEQNEAAQDE